MSAHTGGLLRPLREARRSGERADESNLCENHLELEPAGVLDLSPNGRGTHMCGDGAAEECACG